MIGNTASKRWRLAIDFLAVLTALAISLSGWALYSRFQETNRIRSENARIWRAVICDIEVAVIKDRDNKTTPARKRFILKFYDNLLVKDAHAAPCGLKVTGR